MPRLNVKKVNVSLGDITDKNIGQLRLLHRTLFPVVYSKEFYRSVVNDLNYLTKLAYYGDTLVGSVSCRVEREKGSRPELYVMTLGVLAPYRRLGIGSKLAQHVVEEFCKADRTIKRAYLHIQKGNDSALQFYLKQGYEQGETVDKYYPQLKETAAHVLFVDTDAFFAKKEEEEKAEKEKAEKEKAEKENEEKKADEKA